MRFSVWPNLANPWSEVVATVNHAEATGWDGVYVADHFMPDDGAGDPAHPVLECGSLVAALGAVLPRVRIGTMVYGITYRHPAVLANMAATVDVITGGRFTLGVGAGWQVNEHEQYGIELPPVKQRLDRFVEALRVLRGLLREPTTTVDGEYYQLTDAVCEMVNASEANFAAARADASRWNQSVLSASVWQRASLKAARFAYCDLSHADLSGADCTRADFGGANLHALIDQGAQLSGASFDGARRTDPALARAEQWQPRV